MSEEALPYSELLTLTERLDPPKEAAIVARLYDERAPSGAWTADVTNATVEMDVAGACRLVFDCDVPRG